MIALPRRPADHEADVLSPAEANRVWERYVGFLAICGRAGPLAQQQLRELDRLGREVALKLHLKNGAADGWRFNSIHEAAHFDCEDYFQPMPAEAACEWPPGSYLRRCTLADRVACGEDIFHPRDRRC